LQRHILPVTPSEYRSQSIDAIQNKPAKINPPDRTGTLPNHTVAYKAKYANISTRPFKVLFT